MEYIDPSSKIDLPIEYRRKKIWEMRYFYIPWEDFLQYHYCPICGEWSKKPCLCGEIF